MKVIRGYCTRLFFLSIIGILISGNLSATGNCDVDPKKITASADGIVENANYMTAPELEMIRELNLVRSNPKAYKKYILSELDDVKQDSAYLSSLVSLSIRKRVEVIDHVEHTTIDTTYNNFYRDLLTAIHDLLDCLDRTCPMQILKPHKKLYIAAKDHGAAQAPMGDINHQGTDGSWPWERIKRIAPDIEDGNENIAMGGCTPREIVIQLLIDSGVPGYGHRYNILNPEWEFVGCREVTEMDLDCNYWIQEFGKQFENLANLIDPDGVDR